jgi:hypothetical protein
VTRDHHALLWSGTADSVIDLNPSGYRRSAANGNDDRYQVGYGYNSGFNTRALLWSGSADSAIDLHSILPATFQFSTAMSIIGNTVYGQAYDTNSNWHAIVWSIPEPGMLSSISLGFIALFRRRRSETKYT